MRWLVAMAVVSGCQSSSQQAAPAPAPAAAPAPVAIDAAVPTPVDHAYVADDSGLVEVSPAASQVIVPGAIMSCNADARANVIWYQTDAGLFAFDLQTRKSIAIIKGDLQEITPIIDWGNEKLGGENPLAFQVGIAIDMAKQSLAMVMGCEGDAAVYCYEDDGTTPTKAVKQQQKLAAKLKLADPGAVAMLAARGASRSLWTPPPMPPTAPKPPAIDKSKCTDMPDDCGKLVAIPGSSLWLVTTANSRGDYFHETRELWDPATGEFLAVTAKAVTRSKQPAGEGDQSTDFAGMRLAPSGMSFDGFVFDPKHVIYAPKPSGRTCGWSNGGWRIKWGGE
jgi:hypothetical protein